MDNEKLVYWMDSDRIFKREQNIITHTTLRTKYWLRLLLKQKINLAKDENGKMGY